MTVQADSEPRSEQEWIATASELAERGQPFRAHDLALAGLGQFPNSAGLRQIIALALVRTGSLEKALEFLEQLFGEPTYTPDDDAYGLLGRVYKGLFRRDRSDRLALSRSKEIYSEGFRATGGIYTGVNAAAMTWVSGDVEGARALARQVSERLDEATTGDDFWHHATRGEVALLLGDEQVAIESYRQARERIGNRYAQPASSLEQLRLLADSGLAVPEVLFELLAPPVLGLFTGHMIDRPGRPPRFPASAESRVRERVRDAVERLDVRIGFCSAACGSDILFIEAMKDRGAEVHLVLPFRRTDFIETSVQFAGPGWVERFDRALETADSIKYVTREPYMNDEDLFSFANDVMRGLAELRAAPLSTRPHLVAVYSGASSTARGGASEIIDGWRDPERLSIVDIADVATGDGVSTSSYARKLELPVHREVRMLVFADVVGYSQLDEQDTPLFMRELLARTARRLQRLQIPRPLVNTWGDAIFAVLDNPSDAANYALALQEAIDETDWREHGLSADLSVRVAVHAGPVFVGDDPITGRVTCYGSHVNRAARLEPITIPGSVFCTEQFGAILAAAQADTDSPAYALDYVSVRALAKGFGSEPVYRIRRRGPAVAD